MENLKNNKKVIVDQKRTKVIYSSDKKTYTKYFYPKFEKKLKYFFRFRKYPGKNFTYIAKQLKNIGISVPEIITCTKYSVVTKEIMGNILIEELKTTKS